MQFKILTNAINNFSSLELYASYKWSAHTINPQEIFCLSDVKIRNHELAISTQKVFTVLEYTLHIQAISSTGLVVSTPARREVIKCQMSQEITIKWFEIFHLLRSLASFLARLSSIILGLLSLQASLGKTLLIELWVKSPMKHSMNTIFFSVWRTTIYFYQHCLYKATKTFFYNTRPLFIIVFRQTRYLNWEIILSFITM